MEKAISSDLIRGHIDTIILHSLVDGDKFAQQISDFIEKKSNGEYIINQATLYSSLKRLENLKYVTAYWNDSENGRRRFFKLTEQGNNVANQNLSNWSYSREIIDKLMDLQSEPIYKTQVVEKIVEKVVHVPQPAFNQQPVVEIAKQEPQINIIAENIQQTTIKEESISEQEINFRNILNGLISESRLSIEKNAQEKQKTEIIPTPHVEKNDEKLKLNETITASNYNELKPANSNGNIDYGEMAEQAEKDGYKLRFSTKESKKIKGAIYSNKINLYASLATFLLVMIEYLIVMTCCKKILAPSAIVVILSILSLAIFPITITTIFFVNPLATSKIIKKDSVLTALIVVFNLLLVTFAIDLLIGIDLTNTFYLIVAFIIPCILYFDIFIYFSIKYYLSKRKNFSTEK